MDAGTGEGGRVQIWVKGAVESVFSQRQRRARATWQQDRAKRRDRWHGTFGAEHMISRFLTVKFSHFPALLFSLLKTLQSSSSVMAPKCFVLAVFK